LFFKSQLKKWMTIIIVLLITIIGITFLFGYKTLENKHHKEIKKVITSIHGEVVEIKRIEREQSPFADSSNKSNVIYRVTYKVANSKLVAWYRGVNVVSNIHAQNPSALDDGLNEKWIFPR